VTRAYSPAVYRDVKLYHALPEVRNAWRLMRKRGLPRELALAIAREEIKRYWILFPCRVVDMTQEEVRQRLAELRSRK